VRAFRRVRVVAQAGFAGVTLLAAAVAAADDPSSRAREAAWSPPPLVPLEPEVVLPTPQELEARGAVVGAILVRVYDVFDTADPREDAWLYRAANVLHIDTRPRTVREQLTFQSGEPLRAQRLEESERVLRNRRYLFDAIVRIARYDAARNAADVEVTVRDVWTLNPGVGYSNRGGEGTSSFEIEELNLFGRGEKLQFDYTDDVDRTSAEVQYVDPNVGGSRWALDLVYADLSDGKTKRVDFARPFYSLDARWSLGTTVSDDSRVQTRYDLGEPIDEFRVDRQFADLRFGWSRGLRDGWARRWLAGLRYDDQAFAAVPGAVSPATLPADQRFVYPWIGLEWIEDAFTKTRNRNQIGRTEDAYFGTFYRASVGYSSEALGARDAAWLFAASLGSGRQYGGNLEWSLGASGSGRLAGGSLEDAALTASFRHYWRWLSWTTSYAAVTGTVTEDLDPDRQLVLGGEEGLRGYPLRYQTGSSSALVTLEQRFFTDWYPFRLFNVGGAAFFDSGRTWGPTLGGEPSRGWLSNVGVGLRLGNSRSGLGSVIHVDFTYALDPVPGEDRFQVFVETKQGF
jgi:hypothetical protein